MTNWISVNERLPEENIEVLGICDKGIMWVTSHQNNFFTDHDFNFVEITHWMPLPEPPEADMTTNKQVVALQDECEQLRKDAERYRWLRDTLHNAKAGGGVEVNDALQVYDTPVQGEEVRVYWYPDTPVGFYQIEATTLDEAIDEAMQGANP